MNKLSRLVECNKFFQLFQPMQGAVPPAPKEKRLETSPCLFSKKILEVFSFFYIIYYISIHVPRFFIQRRAVDCGTPKAEGIPSNVLKFVNFLYNILAPSKGTNHNMKFLALYPPPHQKKKCKTYQCKDS